MWFMVCRWPSSQEGDWVRPHLCKLARHGPWPVRKRFIRDHVWWGRLKPGCQIVGSFAIAVALFLFPAFWLFPAGRTAAGPTARLCLGRRSALTARLELWNHFTEILQQRLPCDQHTIYNYTHPVSFGIISHRYSSNDCPATNTQYTIIHIQWALESFHTDTPATTALRPTHNIQLYTSSELRNHFTQILQQRLPCDQHRHTHTHTFYGPFPGLPGCACLHLALGI